MLSKDLLSCIFTQYQYILLKKTWTGSKNPDWDAHSLFFEGIYRNNHAMKTNIHTILSNHSNDNILQTQIRPDS